MRQGKGKQACCMVFASLKNGPENLSRPLGEMHVGTRSGVPAFPACSQRAVDTSRLQLVSGIPGKLSLLNW